MDAALAVAVVACVVAVVALVAALWLGGRLRRLQGAQKAVLGGASHDMVDFAVSLQGRIDDLHRAIDEVATGLSRVDRRVDGAITNTAVVRYDAYEDTGRQAVGLVRVSRRDPDGHRGDGDPGSRLRADLREGHRARHGVDRALARGADGRRAGHGALSAARSVPDRRVRAMSFVTLCDVAPRDGLQNHPTLVEPEVRAELVDRLAVTGLPRIEAVSFVSPARVPQMAGAEEVVGAIARRPGVVYAGLALNERGYDRLLAAGLDAVHFAFAASETFNQRNQGAAVADSVAAAARIVARARVDGLRSTVTISTAFGCPFEGCVAPDRVLELAGELAAATPDEIVLADTIGVAVPRDVGRLVSAMLQLGVTIGVHLHNTRNTGYANALAAVAAGATLLDSSLGGIGGCPFAPRATGNIATEDLVYLLHGEGIETGVDLEALIAVAEWLEGVLGQELEGQVYRAGPPLSAC